MCVCVLERVAVGGSVSLWLSTLMCACVHVLIHVHMHMRLENQLFKVECMRVYQQKMIWITILQLISQTFN